LKEENEEKEHKVGAAVIFEGFVGRPVPKKRQIRLIFDVEM
jgi:hypothetical protein